jgi:hypothetical protein
MSTRRRPVVGLPIGSWRTHRHRNRSAHGLRRMRAAAAAAVLASALALGGCASVRNELGTANSSCYIGLPEAVAAVHHRGHLVGVRLVSVTSLAHRTPLLYAAARQAPGKTINQVCLVAFTGTFHNGAVDHPVGHATGHLAVVELGYPSKRLLATLIVRRLPLPFGHPHL